jgi:hypothetical protein
MSVPATLRGFRTQYLYWLNELLRESCGYKVKYLDIVPSMEDDAKDAKNIVLGSRRV